jgi:HSP20 family molecular chaperone IbpA
MVPPVDVVEDNHGITLWADLPGVTRDKLDIRVEGPNLFIEAEAVVPTPAEMRLQHAEVLQPRYARAFALSGDFDSTKIEANLKNGVLRLTVPRREEARPRRIEVTAS